MNLYNLIVMFIFGITFGSFFNVIGYRLPNKQSIIKPRSKCPNCGHNLKFYELIPLVSYIFLLGRCKKCKKKISPFYFIFEFITGCLFSLCYYFYGFTPEIIIPLTLVSFIIILTVSDLLTMIIPDEVIIFFGILFVIEIFVLNGFTSFYTSLFNGTIVFSIMYLIKELGNALFKKETMGGGDIKLMLIIGLVLGYEAGILTIFLSAFIAFPVAIVLLFIKKKNILPYGPFLGLAALIIMFLNINFDLIFSLMR